jgi:hypothetical protein
MGESEVVRIRLRTTPASRNHQLYLADDGDLLRTWLGDPESASYCVEALGCVDSGRDVPTPDADARTICSWRVVDRGIGPDYSMLQLQLLVATFPNGPAIAYLGAIDGIDQYRPMITLLGRSMTESFAQDSGAAMQCWPVQ